MNDVAGFSPENFIRALPAALNGCGISLQPLAAEHAAGLAEAAADGSLWELPYSSVPAPGTENDYIARALADNNARAFAVVGADGKILGSTRYYDIRADLGRLEIGYTWYAAAAQGSGLNTVCKYLLLRHAFEEMGANTVGFRADRRNTRSRRAIEKLGAHEDGALRNFRRNRDGRLGDSVVYSIIAAEWQAIRAKLLHQIGETYGKRP